MNNNADTPKPDSDGSNETTRNKFSGEVCSSCGGKLTKGTFRTGQTGSVPKPSKLCTKCGTRT